MAKVSYFLEDRAQRQFIVALVEKIAESRNYNYRLEHNILSARGGSRVIEECREFLIDCEQATDVDTDFLVIAIDGNCMGYSERTKQIEEYVRPENPFIDSIAFAIPDPHIERWYLYDQRAFRLATGVRPPDIPTYKCEKGFYKNILRGRLREAGVRSLAGGPDLAEDIVSNIRSIDSLARQNADLRHFVDGLSRQLAKLMR